MGSVDDSSAAELMSARHFGSKPGYLNTVTYLAPSSEVSTFLVTAPARRARLHPTRGILDRLLR